MRIAPLEISPPDLAMDAGAHRRLYRCQMAPRDLARVAALDTGSDAGLYRVLWRGSSTNT